MSMISSIPVGSQAGAAVSPFKTIGSALRGLWITYLERRLHRQAAAHLHGMSDRDLKDIGLSRSEIESAIRGPDHMTPHYQRGRYY